MPTATDLRARIGHLTEELATARRGIARLEQGEECVSGSAWESLTAAAHEVSRRWRGPGAVAEIAAQRGE